MPVEFLTDEQAVSYGKFDFEVNAWTGFPDAFVHLGDGTTRMKDLSTSVVALLVSEACNIGLVPVVNPAHESLTRARLVHVDQYYLRADTIAATNARLIAAQAKVPIVKFWGEGLLASVDGLRFVVPVRTVSAAPSPKYFGFKRGITWLNAVNDQVADIGQMVVPGTPRDSLHILDALLNLDGGVRPEMVATDNDPGCRLPAPAARPGRARAGRGRQRRGLNAHIGRRGHIRWPRCSEIASAGRGLMSGCLICPTKP
ncbi:Tn3 family transposase [Streptosporangium lutulentum]|uniref:Tn3 transposase DDE domain-containing protein n=1 Tax=Streptosporangium lutulentum TaxID=1461250 RepID=A0ABT9QA99_9ACTN|nr:hypothetical protein [Streptosporangium lutulentum]